ncbi:NosD domain-containing protein [Natronobeatus ordinarius]|uniref:NosD domain-containing protein n=1 Tax=Natronobeatus ordinarius TaxID=2963433 RepID=UPI0020CC0E8A|nr:NosD domain-containing protein [Natronobeatus ordinarius]
MREIPRSVWFGLVVALVVVGAAGLFVVDVGATDPDPVHFDDTVAMGISHQVEFGLDDETELPRVQVFYSQYQYVVGYYGVETFVDDLRQEGHEQRFGYPLAVYVTDYSGVDFELSDEGYPVTDEFVGWVHAEDAWYVAGSDARSPAGETVVPFADRDDAEAFADEHGGSVMSWEAVLEAEFDLAGAEVIRERIDDQHAGADRLVEESRSYLERPVSTVVGEDADTVQEAIDAAEPGTTVVVPEGTYEEVLEIDEPITLAGEGEVTIRGDENGSVVHVTADEAAVTGLEVTGVGDTGRDPDAEVDEDEWDAALEVGYGHGDAGVEVVDADHVLIEAVTIETAANGILLRDSHDAVVRDVTVYGDEEWGQGYMGVMNMRASGVIEESTLTDGRDNVYMHRANGLVVRDNDLLGGRYAVHFMYTSDSLIANNTVRDQHDAGIYVMTDPERNAIVDNDVRGVPSGIITDGSDSYIAGNVVVDAIEGMRIGTGNSIYEANVFLENDVGVRSRSVLPSDRVAGNDFLNNEIHATATSGPLRIWTHDGAGNYWAGAIGTPDGDVLDRTYSATDPVDERLHRVDGTPTLAQAPALDATKGLQGTVPGMRAQSIVDTAPRCEPANADALEAAGYGDRLDDHACGATDETP